MSKENLTVLSKKDVFGRNRGIFLQSEHKKKRPYLADVFNNGHNREKTSNIVQEDKRSGILFLALTCE